MSALPRKKSSPGNIKLYKSLGSLIKDFRKWREVSQEKFAQSIGVSVRELQNWEADRRRARIENLHDLSEITGIPMQVCVALNADQPLWYSLRKRRFAYSSLEEAQFSSHELFKYHAKSDDGVLTKYSPITTDKQIGTILSCHHEIYGSEKVLQKDVIKAANRILPELNRIVFDYWGHYVGHQICLPIKKEVYEQIQKKNVFEGNLTPEKISDILPLKEGVFFYYSMFAANASVVYRMVINSVRYYTGIEPKERYLVANFAAPIERKEFYSNFFLRKVRDYNYMDAEVFPTLYEVELDALMRSPGPLGALEWMIEEYDKREEASNPIKEANWKRWSTLPGKISNNINGLSEKNISSQRSDYNPIIVDIHPAIVDIEKQDSQKWMKPQGYKLKMETCPNPKCLHYAKIGEDNVVSNGTYRTKKGILARRFLCKACGEPFCSRTGTIFYDLRSPEEKVLKALKLLVKGMPLHVVAKVLGIKFDTVRHWMKVAAQQSEKIDRILITELNVSQAELDALWTSFKSNSLRQRAILWRGRKSESAL